MKDVARSLPVTQRNAHQLNVVREERPELVDALVVRPIAATHRERRPVEPGGVCALQRATSADRASGRQACTLKEPTLRLRLFGSRALPHAAQHDARVAYDGCVTPVDRVEADVRRRHPLEPHSQLFQQRRETVELTARRVVVGRSEIAQPRPLIGDARWADEAVTRVLEQGSSKRSDVALKGHVTSASTAGARYRRTLHK